VFTTKWGEPLYPDTVTALMTKLINSHNKAVVAPARVLPHARLHDLRHLHATTLLLAGVPVHVVAARLGHADPAITLRVYSHVLRERAQGVGQRFCPGHPGLCWQIRYQPTRRELINPAFPLVRVVVRGGVEPPTFRFSGLRIPVQAWPPGDPGPAGHLR
jgi:hypothetical protein